jgi:monofunctional biosynthetic peptidoglycan transglycosylase
MLDGTMTGTRASHRHGLLLWLRRAAVVAVILLEAFVFLVIIFRFINPPITTVMIAERLRGMKLERRWVPLSDISGELPLAVIAGEDGRFCNHWGVDWGALKDAITEAEQDGGEMRGASTIPMQTAKNIFLWTSRSYIRKGLEMPMAYVMSLFWSKQRMMEVYLNVAQWGPGVFGAEAASQYHFHKSAAELNRHEAALLAAALPSPRVRNPGKPGPRLTRIARAVELRMERMAPRAACVLSPR